MKVTSFAARIKPLSRYLVRSIILLLFICCTVQFFYTSVTEKWNFWSTVFCTQKQTFSNKNYPWNFLCFTGYFNDFLHALLHGLLMHEILNGQLFASQVTKTSREKILTFARGMIVNQVLPYRFLIWSFLVLYIFRRIVLLSKYRKLPFSVPHY